MRLEHLCNIELVYEAARSEKFVFIQPHNTAEPSVQAQTNGIVIGERLRGRVRWVNQKPGHGEGAIMPAVYGLIQTDDGAPIMFTMQCGDAWADAEAGRPVLTAIFEADDERYCWLNNTRCILEGVIDFTKTLIRARIYACIGDLAP